MTVLERIKSVFKPGKEKTEAELPKPEAKATEGKPPEVGEKKA